MKRTGLIFFLLMIIATLILNLVPIHAAINQSNTTTPLGAGISLDKIPQTPEDVASVSLTYLKQEWTKMIAKNKYIGPIHNFFLNHQTIFIILFNEKYEFSLTFILLFILWIFLAFMFGRMINALGLLKMGFGWAAGILCSVVLSQIGLIKLITNSILALIYAKDLWWMRALLWAVLVIVLMLIFYLNQMVSQSIEKSKKEGEERATKEKVEELDEFQKGMKKN